MTRSPLLVGPLPPPVHGLAVAFGSLVDELRRRAEVFDLVDLFPNKVPGAAVSAGWCRAMDLASVWPRLYRYLLGGRRTVYVTVAQARGGFIRDALVIWPAALLRHRIVAHLHGGNYDTFFTRQTGPWRWLIRHTLRRIDRMIVLGDGLRTMFAFDEVVSRRVVVVPNGTARVPLPDRAPRVKGQMTVLYLSNLIESKGWLEVLEAIAAIRAAGVDATARFAGQFLANPSDDRRVKSSAHARALFVQRVAELGLDDSVAYVGLVQGERKAALLAEAEVLVLPTSYDAEGQPVAIIEALAAGCVVVSTAYRAIPDVVRHERTGLLIPGRDADALAVALQRLADDPAWADQLARSARTDWEERLAIDRHADAVWGHITMWGDE